MGGKKKKARPTMSVNDMMTHLGQYIQRLLPAYGFYLVVFPRTGEDQIYYTSNAERDGVIKHLRRTADEMEKGKSKPIPESKKVQQ